jgi:mono/diheme cytochrome c family protein/glucose/arabinose dehydrogenase
MSTPASNLCFSIFLLSLLFACQSETHYKDEIYTKPPIDPDPVVKALSPEESLETIYLPKGYRAELVANEPMVEEPIWITWDGNGKMYVAQMMTYMQDIDANHEDEPWSRVSVLEDTNGDGKMDQSTVFIDSLVLPRIVLPLDDRVIIGETYKHNLWSYRDTDGDRVADEKILIHRDTVRDNRNLEHQPANMLWNIDNWLYLSTNSLRFRFVDDKLIVDTMLNSPQGQYGLTQDETGRMFYSRAGAEVPALGYQQHPIYGQLEMEGKWEEGFEKPWPIVGTIDAQGGPKRIREDEGTLNKFTGVSGQEIFSGDRLPAYGDLFIPEPVARLVRRAKVVNEAGKIVLQNAYHEAEFLASTDPLFRPVQAVTGPDGCLYVVDMYRGIIQEGTWVGEGSYLRDVVLRKGLDKQIGKGRIYRIVHDQMKPGEQPHLLDKSAKELLSYLGHPNQWWRMTAQKLIILKGDESVIPDLKEKARDNEVVWAGLFTASKKDYGIERLHALWTLEGLGALDKELVLEKLQDEDPRVRCAAMRLCEPYLQAGDEIIFQHLSSLANDTDPNVLVQLILTLRTQNDDSAKALVKKVMDANPSREVIAVSAAENLDESFSEIEALKKEFILEDGGTQQSIIRGFKIFQEVCSTCHGKNAEGIDPIGPPLATSPRLMGDYKIPAKILLHGLSGPIDGKTYAGVMAPMDKQDDQWIADVLNYLRAHYGKTSTIWYPRIGRIRKENEGREKYWTLEELEE